MPWCHHVVRGSDIGLFRALASLESCNLVRVGDDVEITCKRTDLRVCHSL
jgi:hypothetical protein